MPFEALPFEIYLRIVTYLKADDVVHLLSCSHALQSIFADPLIWRVLSHNFGSSSGGDDPLQRRAISDQDDLANVIKLQRCARGSFDAVSSWYELAKKQHVREKHWKERSFSSKAVLHDEDGIWRFKIDSQNAFVVYSTIARSNDIVVCDLRDGSTSSETWRWRDDEAEVTGLHVELSNGYLIHTHEEEILVWRRADMKSSLPSPSFPGEFWAEPNAQLNQTFVPHLRLSPPYSVRCYKARWPRLVTGCRNTAQGTQHLLLWSLETGDLLLDLNVAPYHTGIMTYVELTDSSIILANMSLVLIFDIHDGAFQGCLPPALPRRTNVADAPSRWVGVHHDEGNLVSISDHGAIIWCQDLNALVQGTIPASDLYVTTELSGVFPSQLSVENGRCLIIATGVSNDIVHQSLYILNLRRYRNIAAFPAPAIDLLFHTLPAHGPVSRMESDGSAIYFNGAQGTHLDSTGINGLRTGLQPDIRLWSKTRDDSSWKSIDGAAIGFSHRSTEDGLSEDPSIRFDLSEFNIHRRHRANRALWRLDFAE